MRQAKEEEGARALSLHGTGLERLERALTRAVTAAPRPPPRRRHLLLSQQPHHRRRRRRSSSPAHHLLQQTRRSKEEEETRRKFLDRNRRLSSADRLARALSVVQPQPCLRPQRPFRLRLRPPLARKSRRRCHRNSRRLQNPRKAPSQPRRVTTPKSGRHRRRRRPQQQQQWRQQRRHQQVSLAH